MLNKSLAKKKYISHLLLITPFPTANLVKRDCGNGAIKRQFIFRKKERKKDIKIHSDLTVYYLSVSIHHKMISLCIIQNQLK